MAESLTARQAAIDMLADAFYNPLHGEPDDEFVRDARRGIAGEALDALTKPRGDVPPVAHLTADCDAERQLAFIRRAVNEYGDGRPPEQVIGEIIHRLRASGGVHSPGCATCGESDGEPGECPRSMRLCGHHCNCVWTQDCCHWCGAEVNDEGDLVMPCLLAAGDGKDRNDG